MTTTILALLLGGMHIFNDERRRHLSKKLKEKYEEVQKEQNARYPDYNGDRLALAEQALEIFLISYKTEYNLEIKKKGIADV